MLPRDIVRLILPSVASSFTFCESEVSSVPVGDKIVQFIDSSKKRKWVIKYDYRSRNPKWAYEIIEPEEIVENNAKRKAASFFKEPSIFYEQFQVKPKDYNDFGYDRGHMVPAADFAISQDDLNSTFTMANICPQNSVLNKLWWAQLEQWLRFLLTSKGVKFVEIITGPVFAPTFSAGRWKFELKTIGSFPNLITVPTHFFKIVVLNIKEGNEKVVKVIAAFLVPNKAVDVEVPLEAFLVRLDQIQSVVGELFFDGVLSQIDIQRLDERVPDCRDLAVVLSADVRDSSTSAANGSGLRPLLEPIKRAEHTSSVPTDSIAGLRFEERLSQLHRRQCGSQLASSWNTELDIEFPKVIKNAICVPCVIRSD